MDAAPFAPYKSLFDEGRDWFARTPHERVTVRSNDDLTLVGHFIPNGMSRRTVLFMHGYRAQCGLADFGVILPYYYSLGLNLLLVDQRGCGESEGDAICFGVRERFDCAVARAVAPMNVLAEYLLPFVRVGGRMLALKGPSLEAEMAEAEYAISTLGGRADGVIPVEIPGRDWRHSLAKVAKIAPTPEKYPRKAGTPEKKPLVVAKSC